MSETAEVTEKTEISEKTKKEIAAEWKKAYFVFKKQMKTRSKSELVAMLWEQILDFKELQDMSREMFEELRALKGEKNDKEDSSKSE